MTRFSDTTLQPLLPLVISSKLSWNNNLKFIGFRLTKLETGCGNSALLNQSLVFVLALQLLTFVTCQSVLGRQRGLPASASTSKANVATTSSRNAARGRGCSGRVVVVVESAATSGGGVALLQVCT